LDYVNLTARIRVELHAKGHITMRTEGGTVMSIGTILLIVLVLILVGALPTWPHSRSWGYGPTGIVGVLLVLLLILVLLGKI
jgi:hypothetical protein